MIKTWTKTKQIKIKAIQNKNKNIKVNKLYQLKQWCYLETEICEPLLCVYLHNYLTSLELIGFSSIIYEIIY